MMCKRGFILLLIALVLTAQFAQADTIHLKNGSVLKGKIASFADDQFIVMLDTGSGRYMSRAMVYVGDVSRIEFEGAPAVAADGGGIRDSSPAPRAEEPAPTTGGTQATRLSDPSRDTPRDVSRDTPRDTPVDTPRETSRSKSKRDNSPRVVVAPDIPRSSQADSQADSQPRDTSPVDSQPTRQPDATAPDKSSVTDEASEKVVEKTRPVEKAASDSAPAEVERAGSRKAIVPLRTVTIDVIGKRDWTSTGLIVKRGDHIRINASGTVTIDPTAGTTTGPEGSTDLPDPKKLMTDQPTGALIGVISADNDDFIFIGKTSEFTARRDGLLFLSVNEGNLTDNVGSFKAVIDILPQKK